MAVQVQAAPEAVGRRHRGKSRAGPVSLSLLSGFQLTSAGRTVELPMTAQRLLAFLALHERPQQRLHVAGVLWTDSPEERAAANLRSTLWRLRRPGFSLVDATYGLLGLSSQVTVDIREYSRWAHDTVEGTNNLDARQTMVMGGTGELLPDWYEDWVLIERERFRQIRLHALEVLCQRLTASGHFAQAVEAGLAAVRGEPLRESAHGALIRAHLAEGNRAEALRQYDLYATIMRKELGLNPADSIRDLVGVAQMTER
jgi:DNA-binding SARP family transcriptional activator